MIFLNQCTSMADDWKSSEFIQQQQQHLKVYIVGIIMVMFNTDNGVQMHPAPNVDT